MAKEQFVLIGNSLITEFDWQARMPFFEVHDFGTPGETTQELLDKLPSIIDKLENPLVILVVCGTNNVLQQDYDFIDSLEKIIIELTNAFAKTEIIVNSLFPIKVATVKEEQVTNLNKDFERLTMKTGSCFLDMYKSTAESKIPLFLDDGVHLNEKAYDLWSRSIMAHLAFLLEEDDDDENENLF